MRTQVNYELPYCVYAHVVRDRIIYVGKGLSHRPYEIHKRNEKWHSIVGRTKKFEVEILSWHSSSKIAADVERHLIKDLHPPCNLHFNGYTTTKKQKKAASKANKGRPKSERQRTNNRLAALGNKWCLGRVLSVETKHKISEAIKRAHVKGVWKHGKDGKFVSAAT